MLNTITFIMVQLLLIVCTALFFSDFTVSYAYMLPILLQSLFLGFIGLELGVLMSPIVDLMPINSGWIENKEDIPPNSFWYIIKDKLDIDKTFLYLPFIGFIKNKKYADIKQYMVIQSLMFTLFFIGGLKYHEPSQIILLLSFLILVTISILVSWIDFRVHWLPDRFLVTILILGLNMSPFQESAISRIEGLTLFVTIIFLPMFFSSIIRRVNIISGGDLMFLALVGAWLGVNLQVTLQFLVILILLAVVLASYLYYNSKKTEKITDFYFPLGPAISGALLMTLILNF